MRFKKEEIDLKGIKENRVYIILHKKEGEGKGRDKGDF